MVCSFLRIKTSMLMHLQRWSMLDGLRNDTACACFLLYFLSSRSASSRCLSLPGNKKAPYCYDAFVLLGRWSKGTLFNYLLYFFFLLTTVVPMAAPPLINSRAIHSKRLELSPVCGDLSAPGSFAVTVSACLISCVAVASL